MEISPAGVVTLDAYGNGVLRSSSTGVVSSTQGTAGQILRSNSSQIPTWSTLVAGTNISITNVDDTITVTATGSAIGSDVCSFAYARGSNVTNITGDGTEYTTIFNRMLFDVGGDYNSGTGIFTAPVSGKYLFSFAPYCISINSGHRNGVVILSINAGTTKYWANNCNIYACSTPTGGSDNNHYGFATTWIVNMVLGDTAQFIVAVSNGTKTVGLFGDSVSSHQYSQVYGTLLA